MQVIRILSINRENIGRLLLKERKAMENIGRLLSTERERQEGVIYFWDVNLEVILKPVSIQNLAIFLEENLPFYRVSSSWP